MTQAAETFGGRQVIGPNTEVLNGVFFGSGAIVVDFEEKPEPYETGFGMVEASLARSSNPSTLEIALAINSVVRNLIPYSESNVARVLRTEAAARGQDRIRREDEVRLSSFMGGGICHHQTLFGGALIRLLQQRKDVGGQVDVILGSLRFADEPERHIWMVYSKDGEAFEIDSSNTPPIRRLAGGLTQANAPSIC